MVKQFINFYLVTFFGSLVCMNNQPITVDQYKEKNLNDPQKMLRALCLEQTTDQNFYNEIVSFATQQGGDISKMDETSILSPYQWAETCNSYAFKAMQPKDPWLAFTYKHNKDPQKILTYLADIDLNPEEYTEKIDWCLKQGANINFKLKESYLTETPLFYTAGTPKTSLAKILIDKGAKVYERCGIHNNTPLEWAYISKMGYMHTFLKNEVEKFEKNFFPPYAFMNITNRNPQKDFRLGNNTFLYKTHFIVGHNYRSRNFSPHFTIKKEPNTYTYYRDENGFIC